MRDVLMAGLVLVMLLLGAPAIAHEGGAHSMGTIKEITGDRIVLTTKDGTDIAVPLVAGTRILKGDRTVTAADVHPGERAVVHSALHGGRSEATEVRVANAPQQ